MTHLHWLPRKVTIAPARQRSRPWHPWSVPWLTLGPRSRHEARHGHLHPVMAWGYNGSGQLGDGTTISNDVPVPVKGLETVKGISAGAEQSLAYGPLG